MTPVVETKTPFRDLIDHLRSMSGTKEKLPRTGEDPDLVILSGLIKQCFDDAKEQDGLYSHEYLRDFLAVKKIPFGITYEEFPGDGVNAGVMGVYYRNGDISDDTAYKYLERYLADCSNMGMIEEVEINPYMRSITALYNWAYQPLYVKMPNHVYTPDEFNLLLYHINMPFRFYHTRGISRFNCGMPTDMWSVEEVSF